MANFAIAASQQTIDRGNKLLELYMKDGEKKEDALLRIFDIAEKELTKGTHPELEPALNSIEQTINTLIKQVNGIVAGQDAQINGTQEQLAKAIEEKAKIRDDADRKMQEASEKLQSAEQIVETAEQKATQAIKDCESAKEQAATFAKLVDEKDKIVNSLAERLTAADAKLDQYTDLETEERKAKEKISELERDLADKKKEHETAVRELNAEMERKISDAKKDAKIELAETIAAREREIRDIYDEKLRAADRETALLQARLEQFKPES